jgi:hypothetical protein
MTRGAFCVHHDATLLCANAAFGARVQPRVTNGIVSLADKLFQGVPVGWDNRGASRCAATTAELRSPACHVSLPGRKSRIMLSKRRDLRPGLFVFALAFDIVTLALFIACCAGRPFLRTGKKRQCFVAPASTCFHTDVNVGIGGLSLVFILLHHSIKSCITPGNISGMILPGKAKRRIEYSMRLLNLRPHFLSLPATCLAAVASFFFFCTPSSLTCFCDAFFFVAFGDLSPILFGLLLFTHPFYRCET